MKRLLFIIFALTVLTSCEKREMDFPEPRVRYHVRYFVECANAEVTVKSSDYTVYITTDIVGYFDTTIVTNGGTAAELYIRTDSVEVTHAGIIVNGKLEVESYGGFSQELIYHLRY